MEDRRQTTHRTKQIGPSLKFMHWSVQKCALFDLLARVFVSEFSLSQKLIKLSVFRSPTIQQNLKIVHRLFPWMLIHCTRVEEFRVRFAVWRKEKNTSSFKSNFLLKAKVNNSNLIDQTVARARNKDHCLRVMSLLEI